MEQATQHLVPEVPEPAPDTAQALEASVDRFDRTVRRATAIEVRQHVSPFPPQRPPQLSKLVQPCRQISAQQVDHCLRELPPGELDDMERIHHRYRVR